MKDYNGFGITLNGERLTVQNAMSLCWAGIAEV